MERLYGRFRVYEEFLQPEKSDTVLSIGCRFGHFEKNILQRVNKIYAMDVDKNQLELGREKEPRIIFEYGDITKKTRFPDEYFDKIIFTEVIEHLPEGMELKALREINRILKKGGMLLFSTPNDHIVSKFSDPLWWVAGHRHYSPGKINDILEKSGFSAEKTLIGGGYLQSLLMPGFYLLCVSRLYNEGSLDRAVNHEYVKEGFWTIIIKARKECPV